MRRIFAVLVVAGFVGVACADDSDDAASKTDTGEETGFVVPSELVERVEDAGFELAASEFPAQPDGVPWPIDEWPTGVLTDDADRQRVAALVDEAFAQGTGAGDVVHAVLVVDDGKLVLEEYNDWDPEAKHNSWSLAKPISAALVGILAGQGRLDVFAPAAAPEWSGAGDPRAEITVDSLLRMSSGLQWSEDYNDPEGDPLQILGGEGSADRAGYAAKKPLEDDVDTAFSYSTGTANIVAREVAMEVGLGPELEAWIQQNLFDPLGIVGAEHRFDETGVISAGQWINLRPVDFARFGYLILRGGEWEGQQLLPRDWVEYSRLPTPTADQRVYGAHWWLIEDRPELLWASGFNGQHIVVAPQEDLLIVILSESTTGRPKQLRDDLLETLLGPAQG